MPRALVNALYGVTGMPQLAAGGRSMTPTKTRRVEHFNEKNSKTVPKVACRGLHVTYDI